jgi:hypothetical protein
MDKGEHICFSAQMIPGRSREPMPDKNKFTLPRDQRCAPTPLQALGAVASGFHGAAIRCAVPELTSYVRTGQRSATSCAPSARR